MIPRFMKSHRFLIALLAVCALAPVLNLVVPASSAFSVHSTCRWFGSGM